MNGATYFIRCEICKEMYRPIVNLLTGEPLWISPQSKRGGCSHHRAEVWREGQWFFTPMTAEIER